MTRGCAGVLAFLLINGTTGLAAAGPRSVAGFAAPEQDGAVPVPDGTGSDRLTPTRFAGGRDWPALRLRAATPLNWSGAAALVLPVENPGDRPFRLVLRLDDDPAADGGDRSLTASLTLPAHVHGQVVMPLESGPTGMRGRPIAAISTQPGDLAITDLRGSVDLHHIVALHVSGVRTPDDEVIGLGTALLRDRAAAEMPGGPVADRFGQAVAGHWPEKVADDGDLRAKLATAARRDAALPRAGTPQAPGRRGTGFFRVEKAGGRWRLVSPAGQPFFSLGVDAVTSSNPTIVQGRQDLFAGLPSPGSPLARYIRTNASYGRTFDIGEANLERGLGPAWRRGWAGRVVARLKDWGFNTLGNWSDPGLAASGLASVLFIDVEGDSAAVPMEGGRSLPDPFDPRYSSVADGVAAQMAALSRDAPALLGTFSGNEMPWGSADRPDAGIAARVLRLGAESPAKQDLVRRLKERYGTYDLFAIAWGLPPGGSWAALLADAMRVPVPVTPTALEDIRGFQHAFADRYFAIVANAIKRHDPDHLYLGTRFADAPPEVVEACARWCDVISFNVYGADPVGASVRWRSYDRPVLIGEFHFGSTDRGSYWAGMVDAGSEAGRGPAYAAYLEAAVRDPAIIGVHWYQYADEPLTGRPYDGENGHIGLVAVTDIPYASFVTAVARANRRALAAFGAAMPR